MKFFNKKVHHYNLLKDGFLSALPFICYLFVTFIASALLDRARATNLLSITNLRKIGAVLALAPAGICFFLISKMGCDSGAIVALMCVIMGFNGFSSTSFLPSLIDMSPSYAGKFWKNIIKNQIEGPIIGLFGRMPLEIVQMATLEYTVRTGNSRNFAVTAIFSDFRIKFIQVSCLFSQKMNIYPQTQIFSILTKMSGIAISGTWVGIWTKIEISRGRGGPAPPALRAAGFFQHWSIISMLGL